MLRAVAELEGDTEASFEARLSLLSDGRFTEEGVVSFGGLDTFRVRSLQPGELAPSADAELTHAAALLGVDSGSGAFSRATGCITSNFLLSTSGHVTDRVVAVVFEAPR